MAIAPAHPQPTPLRSLPMGPAPVRPAASRDLSPAAARVLMIVITALAAGLRLWNSAVPSFRLDEGFTVRIAAMPLQTVYQGKYLYLHSLFQTTGADVHPPGYLVLMHFWMQFFGTNLAVLRLPSELASILAVSAVYLLGRSLYSRSVGVVAALLAASSPFWIWHAQEARMYSFLVLFTVLSTYGLVLAVEHRKIVGWLLFLVATVLAIYTQYYAFLTVAAQGLWVLSQWRRIGWRGFGLFIVSLLLAAMAYVPWLLVFLANYHGASDPSLTPANLYTPLVMLSDFFFGYLSTPVTSNVVAAWPLLVPLALAIGTWGRRMSHRGLLLWLLFLLPITAALLVTYLVRPILSERYLIVSLPALYILVGIVLAEIRGRLVQVVLLASILAVSLVGWRVEEVSAANPESQNYRAPVQYIENHIRPGDIVGLDAYFNQDAYTYYSHLNVPVYDIPVATTTKKVLTLAQLAPYLQAIEAGRTRLWMIYYLETNGDPHNLVHRFLDYHTAGHTVIYGGPFRRNDPHHPGSYLNVQLVLYRLIRAPAEMQQPRPETMQELRSLTHISPTLRQPFASPFGKPGERLPMVGALGGIPKPRTTWYLPPFGSASSVSSVVALNLFNPNNHAVMAEVTTGRGPKHGVRIPPGSDLDVNLRSWVPGMGAAPLFIHAHAVIVAHLTISTKKQESFIYATTRPAILQVPPSRA